jgi:hypothetical protein
MRKKSTVIKSDVLDLGPVDFSLFGGLSEEDVKRQLANRDPFYDKFLLFDKSKKYTLEEYLKIRKVLGWDVPVNKDIYQHLYYQFPNKYGISVARGTHTLGFWEVVTLKFADNTPKNGLPKRKRLRNKSIKKSGSTASIISDPKKYTNFSDVETHMAKLLDTHLLPV